MRESRTLEYKENLSSNTFLKTISAYANYGEGKIIFGINDQGNVIGITDPVNGCLNLENTECRCSDLWRNRRRRTDSVSGSRH